MPSSTARTCAEHPAPFGAPIADIQAWVTSFPVPAADSVRLGDVNGVWQRIYSRQVASGIGAGCAIAMTGIDRAATLHVLAAIEGHGYFEADVSHGNLFRDELVDTPFAIGDDGCVRPSDKPGIGVEVDEAFLDAHPAIEGPAYA